MNPTAILALIGDLYQQIAALTEENQALRSAQEEREQGFARPAT
jgi:hypothetical protein